MHITADWNAYNMSRDLNNAHSYEENCMATNSPQPKSDDYLIAEDNPVWLQTSSPFDALDNDWYRIIIFYVFHTPVSDLSVRSKALHSYGWGKKSDKHDFKVLKKRLIKYSSMNEDTFRSVPKWEDMKTAFQETDLLEFPTDLQRQRVVYRKTKSGELDSLLSHIRNSFAHGRLAFFSYGENTYAVMEDIENKKRISARIIVSKRTLLLWKAIIEAGPFIPEEDLEKQLSQKD